MKNQIRPQFPTPRSIGYGAGYLIAEPRRPQNSPSPWSWVSQKVSAGDIEEHIPRVFRHPWNIAAAPCRDSDVAVLLAVDIDHGLREKRGHECFGANVVTNCELTEFAKRPS